MATLTLKNNRGLSISINNRGELRINGQFTYNGTQLEALEQIGFELEEDVPTNNIGSGNIASNNGAPARKGVSVKSTEVIKRMLRRKMKTDKNTTKN